MTRVPGRGLGQIKFDGLMIGRYDHDRRIYQLGVLPAEGHKFTICYQIDGPRRVSATSVTLPEERGIWRLGIANREPDTELYYSETEPDRHNPPNDPTSREAMDFGWVLDLESDEFPGHPKPMPLIRGKLKAHSPHQEWRRLQYQPHRTLEAHAGWQRRRSVRKSQQFCWRGSRC